MSMIAALKAGWSKSDWPKRLMSSGLGLTIVGLVAFRLGVPEGLIGVVLFVGSALLGWGYLLEAYGFIKRVLETLPGKLMAALLATCVGAVSAGLASQVINEATGLDPSELDYAVAFLAPLTAGFMITAFVVTLAVIASIWFFLRSATSGLFGWFYKDRKKDVEEIERETLRFSGVLGLLVVGVVVWGAAERPYRTALALAANVFIYELEFHAIDPCAGPGEKIRRINDEIVVAAVSAPGRLDYVRRSCPLTAP